mgnify:CR=1 FL=1
MFDPAKFAALNLSLFNNIRIMSVFNYYSLKLDVISLIDSSENFENRYCNDEIKLCE